MKFNFEKITNFIIGIVLINNLYLLTGVIGVSSNSVIILCFILSFLFFIKSFNINQLINQTNNWNTAFYLIASIPLLLVDWILNKSTPNFNDLIRVLMYSFYFSWTFNLYIHSITDFGYFQDKTSNTEDRLLGLGFGFGLFTKNGLFNLVYANGSTSNQAIKLSNSIVHISFKTNF
jgi:hypothetical protein